MVDPTSVIGTVAAVLQLAQSACKAALELYNFCSVVQNAPQEIISISQNAQAFYMVISDLERALRSGTVATVVSGDVEITTTLETLKIPIENCSLACEVPMEKLIPHLPVDSSSQAVVTTDTSGGTSQIQRRRFSRGNVMWFFKRKQILALEADLKRTNTALGTSLSSAILVVVLKTRAASGPNILVQGSLDTDDDLVSSEAKHSASQSCGERQGDFRFHESLGSALTKYAALVVGTRNDHFSGYELIDDVLVDT